MAWDSVRDDSGCNFDFFLIDEIKLLLPKYQHVVYIHLTLIGQVNFSFPQSIHHYLRIELHPIAIVRKRESQDVKAARSILNVSDEDLLNTRLNFRFG